MWHAWDRGETCTGFWWESPKEEDHVEDQVEDGKMGLEWILGRLTGGGLERIHLVQDRDRLWAVVNAVMNLRVLSPRSYFESSGFHGAFLQMSVCWVVAGKSLPTFQRCFLPTS
jgi:hypothetical protein